MLVFSFTMLSLCCFSCFAFLLLFLLAFSVALIFVLFTLRLIALEFSVPRFTKLKREPGWDGILDLVRKRVGEKDEVRV
jgi:hypothetical protein